LLPGIIYIIVYAWIQLVFGNYLHKLLNRPLEHENVIQIVANGLVGSNKSVKYVNNI